MRLHLPKKHSLWAEQAADDLEVLKGHGISRIATKGNERDLKGHGRGPSGCRAEKRTKWITALAAEGMRMNENALPQGLKPKILFARLAARRKPCPFKVTIAALAMTLLFIAAAQAAAAKDEPRSFSLSTTRTFAPGESVKIQLYSRNVPALEFRVYQVRDAQKFFAGLKDVHSFGVKNYSPTEQIEERTWIERLHDFKAHLWWLVRRFFRGQFTDEARDSFREQQGNMGKKSKVVGAAEFARIPLLNQSQLVARWKLETPPAIVSETEQLPIDGLAAGVYLIEATDGAYKAYTVAIVTGMAMVERTGNGQANVYLANRKTGAPIEKADVVLYANGSRQSSVSTGADGMASLTMTVRGGAQGAEPENVWLLALHGADAALVTPWSYAFAGNQSSDLKAYVYTDRPVYRPGHTVHIKAVVRSEKNDVLDLPPDNTLQLKVTDADDKTVLSQSVPVSAHGTMTADLNLAADAGLGYYSIALGRNGQMAGVDGQGSFYVEEYKKPEYQVTVKPTAPRVLQGNSIQAAIEARYFFGEPVANAKVTYVVHTSQHYWWDEDEADDSGEGGGDSQTRTPAIRTICTAPTEQQEHEGMLDANGRLTVTIPTAIDGKHNDQDYRIEARVTDAANREVAGHSTVLATYGSFRVSVEPTSYLFQPGQPVRVKVTAQDYDSKPIQTPVHIAVNLQKWDSTTRRQTSTPVSSRDATTGADGTALVDLEVSGSGDFEVTASAQTPENRTVQGRTWVWIWSGAGEFYNQNAQAQIIADKKSYQVGDVAHLLLVTGLDESWAVVTAEGDSVQSRQLLHATGKSFAFDVPITKLAQPNLVVGAVIVHDDQVMTAQKNLKVPLVERTLTITATPSKAQYLPGEKGSFDVLAVDSNHKPVEADLSFGEVDEALYSVRPDSSGDIVASFYPRRYVYLNPQTSFSFFFSGEAGSKSPLLAKLANGLYPSAAGAGKAGLGPGGAQGAQGLPRYGLLESQRAYRSGRPRARGVQLPRCVDHLADDHPRHDRRRQGRRRGNSRAGAQEPHRAPGRAALLPPGRRSYPSSDSS